LSKAAADRTTPEIRYDIAPSVQLIARDSFVAETASKIEQLQATAEQDLRWQTFQKGEKRSKEAKLEELVRSCRDLKARFDRIEARSGGDFHAYNSFEAVSRKISELETFRDEARRIERTLTLKAWLLCAAVGAAALVIVLANAMAH